ncbi:hypothetical protein [Janthinobacterium sp. SUN033]|uniref:hypothetical protein n=1 Tax=Janthinobacterium sp. SUN033 TaxID=3002439 RepID=UPI0025B00F92|nr:hypothetical protein [Janthinobacterium sp. SUN033]MDN2680213.1 hypothetical protein [Janthinobacterium sp. SUN033]
MKLLQPLGMAMLALSACAGSAAASTPPTTHAQVVSDDSLGFTSTADNPGWDTPDLPYARLLAQSTMLNTAPRWSSTGARHGALPPSAAATAPAVQQTNVPPPVPEASMVSMLLVGLGLLAFSMHGEKQEKFDS